MLTPYHLMKERIEKESSLYLSQNPEKTPNAFPPLSSYKRKEITIELLIDQFSRDEIFNVIEILNDYYSHFSEFRAAYGYTFKGELERHYSKISNQQKKENEMEISFHLEAHRPLTKEIKKFLRLDNNAILHPLNVITFKKEAEFHQEEINCLLEIWKKYLFLEKEEEKATPQENLFKMGALIYEENEEFIWQNIAGYTQIKEEIKQTIVLPFHHPHIYEEISKLTRTHFKSNIPRAVLFEGPPGTGKTTIARIIANEAQVPLVYVPIESIMSCWYGVAEQRLAKIFDHSSQLEKCLLFLDEIDSLAGSREKEMHEASRRVLSVLLRKMQGLVSVENVLTIGATNRFTDLDPALLSRFNRIISFPLPLLPERKAIFHYYAKHLPSDDLERLAQESENKSGRDIEDICGDAERAWASQLISQNSSPSPPPLQTYLQALQSKY